jgi:threonine aldolase
MQEHQIICFASDNVVGAHPKIMTSIIESMSTPERPYGDDSFSQKAQLAFQKIFTPHCKTYFMGTGTAANVVSLKSFLKSIHSIFCTDIAHINGPECGALENLCGAKIIPIQHQNGKITLKALQKAYKAIPTHHHNKPQAISLTQPTELGTVYTCQELKAICDFAHAENLWVHMDGARLANAAIELDKTFKEITADAGIDILSFGATKNGGLIAEAVVILNQDLDKDFVYYQKQSLQLLSKMRIIPAQFLAYFQDNLWKKNAQHANDMAKAIAFALQENRHIKIIAPVQTNQLFLKIPLTLKEQLFKKYYVYVQSESFEEKFCVIRIVTSYCTTREQIHELIFTLKHLTDSIPKDFY